ncbi:hypothetical protein PBY51_000085 [Eleginops maclovinus]|uniref:Uncharacterized protein n=1 Tax=Eleginops maclovinus TaxID=56733 RepID=A0AAN8APZ7_ELEMC|nr:hypothetical protein PBY51_000085 [Eleginops maclovinus]
MVRHMLTLCPSARLPARPPPTGSARTHIEPEQTDSGRSLRPHIITRPNVHPRSSALQVRRAVSETDNATDPQHVYSRENWEAARHHRPDMMEGWMDMYHEIYTSTPSRSPSHSHVAF